MIVGGPGAPHNAAVPTIIKGTPLMVNGVLYVTSPDNGWALDARDGKRVRRLQTRQCEQNDALGLLELLAVYY